MSIANTTLLAQPVGQIYRNTNYGFQFAVPEGWTVTETNFEVFHYNDVFLTVNNRRPGLTLQEQWTSKGTEFGGKIVLKEMQPGEAYISIGYFDGPGGRTMRSDGVANDLLPLLKTNRIVESSERELSELDLFFFKRGHSWHISSYLREPVDATTRNQVLSFLNSFQFNEAPVSNAAWAENLAWEQLPENIRKFANWPVSDNAGFRPYNGRDSVFVEKIGSDYNVQFTLSGLGSWAYMVATDGKVKNGTLSVDVVSPPSSQIPYDLPGQNLGKINTYWVDPYVEASEIFGKTTITRFDSDDKTKPPTVGAPDRRPVYEQYNPKPGWIGLQIHVDGKPMKTIGPYLPCYPDYEPVLNDDGSAALLVWRDESKTVAQIIAFNTNGEVRFQTDCGPEVFSPIVAQDGSGVLVRPNGDTNVNSFMWFTEKGKGNSIDVSPNPEFIGWIPGTYKSLFSTSLGFQCSYRLIDWHSGKKLWEIPGFGERALGIALTPTLVILAADEPYPTGVWDKVDESLLQSGKEWIRVFYAVSVEDGKIIASWRGQFPHRWFATDHDHFSRKGERLFYVTADEFTEINVDDILAKRNGWQ